MTVERTYGSRFLDAWKRYSTTLGSFDYAVIQRMKAAEREEFLALLRERSRSLPYATIQLIRECDPEEAARVMHAQAMQASGSADISLWILLALT